jgi:hypothetical protein
LIALEFFWILEHDFISTDHKGDIATPEAILRWKVMRKNINGGDPRTRG